MVCTILWLPQWHYRAVGPVDVGAGNVWHKIRRMLNNNSRNNDGGRLRRRRLRKPRRVRAPLGTARAGHDELNGYWPGLSPHPRPSSSRRFRFNGSFRARSPLPTPSTRRTAETRSPPPRTVCNPFLSNGAIKANG